MAPMNILLSILAIWLPEMTAIWLPEMNAAPASFISSLPRPTICEQSIKSPRIAGGHDAVEGSWPWQVSIWKEGKPYCGGSLIDDQWVLSAAHCFIASSIEQFTILLGAHQLCHLSDNVVFRSVQKMFIHHSFTGKDDSSGDIALLKLDSPVMFSSRIHPIHLPKASQDLSYNPDCWVAGWGGIEQYKALQPPLTLQQVQVPIINRESCNHLFNMLTVPGLMTDPVKEDMICAGYLSEGKSACKGDSGGPLVCRNNGYWTQVGIVSWGPRCDELPVVYTLVPYYDNWIGSKISRG